jgi:hypothetical protein
VDALRDAYIEFHDPNGARPRHSVDARRRGLGHEVDKLAISRDTAKVAGSAAAARVAHPHKAMARNRIPSGPPPRLSRFGSPAGSQKSFRIMRQDWTERVRFFLQGQHEPTST